MTIEVTAKKVDEAIKNGLEQLGASLDEVQVEVIESGGLFRKAKVRLTLERESSETAEEAPVPEQKKADEKPPVKPEPVQKKPAAQPEKPQERAAQKPDAAEPRAKAEKQHDKKADKKSDKPTAKRTEQSKNDKSAGRPAPEPAEKAETPTKGEVSAKDEQPLTSEEPQKPTKKSAKKDRDQAKDRKQNAPESAEPREKRSHEEVLAARKAAAAFVKDIVEKMGFDATVELDETDGERINITADAGDDSLLIGRHGETLTALSYIAETAARAEKNRVDIVVDCNGYRERRAASLSAMARRRANECANKHRRIKLEPMERIDRRTIHNALTGDDRVTTVSEGKEPYRYVVILPASSHKRRDQKPHNAEKPVAAPTDENNQDQE